MVNYWIDNSGNVIGYHVTQPCEPCMDACNNGHFWMFQYFRLTSCQETVQKDRTLDSGAPMVWSQIPRADSDSATPGISRLQR